MILQRFNEVIFEGYKETISGNSFELKEDAKQAKCKKAKFQRTQDLLVYKFDKEPKRNGQKIEDKLPFLNDIEAVKSMPDFLLFYFKNNKLFIIICNLKSGKKANNADQMASGKIFANFIFETIKRCYSPDFEDIEPIVIPVLFSSTLLYKSSSHSSKSSSMPRIRNFVSNDMQTDICDLDTICH